MDSNGLCGRFDFIHGGIWLAQRNVFGNRAREQVCLLGDHDDSPSQLQVAQVAKVNAVESHATGARVIEARNQLGERRLARTGGANQGDGLAGRDVEVEPWQHGLAVRIVELDIIET